MLFYLSAAANLAAPDNKSAWSDCSRNDEARENFGLEVPGDISIVGFDGVGPARFTAYDVTTVR